MTWEDLWAYGRYDLRLSEEAFWALTPREFQLLARRADVAVQWEDLRHALAPYTTAAAWSKKGSKLRLSDFVVGDLLRDAEREARRTPEDRQQALGSKINAVFGMLAARARAERERN